MQLAQTAQQESREEQVGMSSYWGKKRSGGVNHGLTRHSTARPRQSYKSGHSALPKVLIRPKILPVVSVTEAEEELSGIWRITDVLDQCVAYGSLYQVLYFMEVLGVHWIKRQVQDNAILCLSGP